MNLMNNQGMMKHEYWMELKKKTLREILTGRGMGGVWIIAFHLDNLSI